MTKSTFYYEDGLDNVFNENGDKVVDPMEGVLTDITDPNIVLVTITSREAYLATKPKDDDKDTEMVDISMIEVKVAKAPVNSTYINYDGHTREKFIDRMIEGPVRRGRVAEVARQFGIAYNTANRW
ncbi:hypothetical protein BDF21DRAFT_331918 [Thamnidium elegans]|nr:hypothetical protein BDF21DRAFT_331918 [Thamnidium elegans]